MTQFTPAELQAAEDAFRLHAQAKCPDDCSFCYDLLLSGLAHHKREYDQIAHEKAKRRNHVPYPKPVQRQKGKAVPLAGRTKKASSR